MMAMLTTLPAKAVMDAYVMSDFGVGDLILRIAERSGMCKVYRSLRELCSLKSVDR